MNRWKNIRPGDFMIEVKKDFEGVLAQIMAVGADDDILRSRMQIIPCADLKTITILEADQSAIAKLKKIKGRYSVSQDLRVPRLLASV